MKPPVHTIRPIQAMKNWLNEDVRDPDAPCPPPGFPASYRPRWRAIIGFLADQAVLVVAFALMVLAMAQCHN